MYGKQDDPARSSASIEEWRDWAQHCGMPGLRDLLGELRAAREELASWRSLRVRVTATMADDEIVPQRDAYYLAIDGGEDDGDDVDVPVRADCLAAEIVRRQARIWVRAAELTPAAVPLEQLLAMVPPRYALASRQTEAGHLAWWHLGQAGILAEGSGRDMTAAIRAATIALLRGRRRCGTCAHWGAEDEIGNVRSCRTDEDLLSYTAESSCSDGWAPAQWLKDGPAQLPTSPARLVRAALAWADETAGYKSVALTNAEAELFEAANELRGIEPGDEEGGS